MVHTGSSQSTPASGPEGMGCVLSSTSSVDTMSLSATGSKKAPNCEVEFCGDGNGGMFAH